MSQGAPPQTEDQLPIKKYLDTSKHLFTKVKNFDFKQLFQGLIIFISIIAAYFIVELSHQHTVYFQRITKINLKQSSTLALLFFVLSLYLIFWNLVARFLKNRALRPPPKTDQYEETPQPEPETPPTLAPLPNGQKYFHQIIYESFNRTIYLFLALVAVASHAYLNQPKNDSLPSLVNIERLNYLGIWFLTANLFALFGDFLNKITKIRQFRILGNAIGFIIGFLLLGLANGLNTFIFI